MATKKALSNRAWLQAARDYLPAEASICEVDAKGQAAAPVRLEELSGCTFYLFDAESFQGFWHALAELALEEANGTVLATWPGEEEGEHARECLAQLARTVERVILFGLARRPQGFPPVRCLGGRPGRGVELSLLLYAGRRTQALLLGRPAAGPGRDRRGMIGFYTLDSRLVRHFQALATREAGGSTAVAREFLRLQTIDQAAKALRAEFDRQGQVLHQAVRRLQFDDRGDRTRDLTAALERGLSRLQQWRTRLPALVARAAHGEPPHA